MSAFGVPTSTHKIYVEQFVPGGHDINIEGAQDTFPTDAVIELPQLCQCGDDSFGVTREVAVDAVMHDFLLAGST